ncbi:PE family protein [Streptomyces sp. TLI_235]|nr:PE domain-containing protein [Streptomyces sp. TLI_235]PBC70909.1 PE family protein [Streptomyces sp. TLI_235]
MSEPDFRVRPDALQRYAALVEQQSARLAAVQGALAGVEVPAGAFGHLPDSEELREGYFEHAQAEQENLADLMEVLDHVSGGLQESASAYRDSEDEIGRGVGGGAR